MSSKGSSPLQHQHLLAKESDPLFRIQGTPMEISMLQPNILQVKRHSVLFESSNPLKTVLLRLSSLKYQAQIQQSGSHRVVAEHALYVATEDGS